MELIFKYTLIPHSNAVADGIVLDADQINIIPNGKRYDIEVYGAYLGESLIKSELDYLVRNKMKVNFCCYNTASGDVPLGGKVFTTGSGIFKKIDFTHKDERGFSTIGNARFCETLPK